MKNTPENFAKFQRQWDNMTPPDYDDEPDADPDDYAPADPDGLRGKAEYLAALKKDPRGEGPCNK